MPKILIAQEKLSDSKHIESLCKSFDYHTLPVTDNYDEALHLLHTQKPDLLVTSIKLVGEKNGLDLAKTAQEKYGVATMFVTSYFDDDVLKEAKKVDFYGYIIKPFKDTEFEATLRLALFQVDKKRKVKKRYVDINGYVFDIKKASLYDEKEEIHISTKSKRLLCFLSQNLGKTKSYSEIIEYVYGDEDVSVETLRQLVKRTRKIVKKDSIETVRDIGYRLVDKNPHI